MIPCKHVFCLACAKKVNYLFLKTKYASKAMRQYSVEVILSALIKLYNLSPNLALISCHAIFSLHILDVCNKRRKD